MAVTAILIDPSPYAHKIYQIPLSRCFHQAKKESQLLMDYRYPVSTLLPFKQEFHLLHRPMDFTKIQQGAFKISAMPGFFIGKSILYQLNESPQPLSDLSLNFDTLKSLISFTFIDKYQGDHYASNSGQLFRVNTESST